MDAQENPGFWVLVVILIGIVGLSGGGWYYANVVRHDALVVDHTPSKPDLKVVGHHSRPGDPSRDQSGQDGWFLDESRNLGARVGRGLRSGRDYSRSQ